MIMLLAPEHHKIVAKKAYWLFDCYFGGQGDSVVFIGDGVDDLDRLISTWQTHYNPANKTQRFLCDVGTQYSDWRPFDLDDVLAIRQAYVQYHGETAKPDVYKERKGAAFERKNY